MNQPLPPEVLLYAYVDDEEEENRILREVADELAEELYEEIDDAYENLVISPGIALGPQKRLQRYLTLLDPTWTADLPLLLSDDYLALFKQGLVPAVLAMPWAGLLRFPRIFERIRKDFVKLYREQVEDMAIPAALLPPVLSLSQAPAAGMPPMMGLM